MARLRLKLHNVICFEKAGEIFTETKKDIAVSTENEGSTLYLETGGTSSTKEEYKLSLSDLSFKKKMYQPTEIIAEYKIGMATGKDSDWKKISREQIETTFKYLRVTLDEVPAKDDQKTVVENLAVAASSCIGDDFYVYEVLPRYRSKGMYMTLKINSLDKILTLRNACRAFTAKTLGGILTTELEKYGSPYIMTASQGLGAYPVKLSADTTNMRVLFYTKDSKTYEHIFPYLVQYNESFYDMLARTCNRWGEFLYYENRKLRIGYDNTAANVKSPGDFEDIYYFDYGKKDAPGISEDGYYDLEASNEFNDSKLKKSPKEVEGILFSPGEKGDKVGMKLVTTFLKNEKNLPTLITNYLFDELWTLASKEATAARENIDFDNEHFKTTTSVQYKDGKEFYQFTEAKTDYTDKKYSEILAKEEAAVKNAIHIDYDTNCPRLSLGNIISYDGEKFIVVEVNCKKTVKLKYKLENGKKIVDDDPATAYVFDVIATACDGDAKDNVFYPAIIPGGHIRQASPQMGYINNADDPSGKNQVRVVFPWQFDQANGKKYSDAKDDATPWLKFATNAAGSPVVGQHYKGDQVLVGFVDGNVERPYVLGGLAAKGSGGADIIQTTPGSHTFKLTDDPNGITNFLTGMFLPVWGTAAAFFPQMSKVPSTNWEASKKLGGGFELSDNYGIYKVSGSTDNRNISISSPWGDVKLDAFTGITISAPNGDVKISGKNVTIEAGNNLTLTSGKNVDYKLWKEKKTAAGEIQYILLDMAAAVAKKLTEKMINIVDLSMIRNVVEIVMRPVEGSLTVKSNRFLKLEAGKDECSYPADGYSDFRTSNGYLKMEDKLDAKTAAGFNISRTEQGTAMAQIIEKIGPMVAALDQKYKTIYNNCCKLKSDLNTKLGELDNYVSTKNTKSYKAADFNTLYANLKNDLWNGKYEPFKEDQLFSDEVKVEGDLNTIVSLHCWTLHQADFPNAPTPDDISKGIVKKRKKLRKEALAILNNLRKEICNLVNLEFNASDINKHLSWFLATPAPKDYKKKMNAAFSRGKCPASKYYVIDAADHRRDLSAQITADQALTNDDLKYMKRTVALNLLKGFGFSKEFRTEVGANPTAVPPVAGTIPAEPKVDTMNSEGADNIMNDALWTNYVASLNGVPKLERDKSLIAGAIEGAAMDAWKKINFWEGVFEKFSWGEGKKGKILFGSGGNTFAIDKAVAAAGGGETANLKTITPLSPKIKGLTQTDSDLSDEEKDLVKAFVDTMKTELNKY